MNATVMEILGVLFGLSLVTIVGLGYLLVKQFEKTTECIEENTRLRELCRVRAVALQELEEVLDEYHEEEMARGK